MPGGSLLLPWWPGLHEGHSSVFDAGPFWAGWLLGLAAPLDNIDGCVAILTGRDSLDWGYVLDSCVDRICDGLALLALWAAGAPVGSCVAAGCALGLLEYMRAQGGRSRRQGGRRDPVPG